MLHDSNENIAAIDVGSNAIRMVIGKVNGGGYPKMLESIREPVRLGQDVFTKGSISEATTERAIEAFIKFRKLIYKYEVKRLRAVATSALREAHNREMFIDRISQTSGIDIQVIGGEEEARLIHLAVAQSFSLKGKNAMLIDIGGGSVEITLVADGQIAATESFNMGTVRLLQKLEEKKTGQRQFNQLVREYVGATGRRIKKEIGSQKIDLCIGTGGNVESLGDLRKEYLGKENDRLTKDDLESLIQKLQGLSIEERIQELRLRPDRADVIIPAGIVLQKVMKQAGVDELVVPRVGLKEGVLLDMVVDAQTIKFGSHYDQAMNSARRLGQKYAFDEEHGTSVARFSVQLFDAMQDLHNLNVEARLILEVASMLHDIGQFVNIVGHHKHTYYLITSSPLIGLTETQKAIAANVARYHRKAPPTVQHEGYRNLSSKQRVVVTKLASILRMADALDTEHGGRVTRMAVEHKKPQFIFKLSGEGDLLLEKWALLRRAPLFEETFSVKVAIDG